ncbi:hypothetical protein ACHQM5_010756 [Ranunculus cassubicifolius]
MGTTTEQQEVYWKAEEDEEEQEDELSALKHRETSRIPSPPSSDLHDQLKPVMEGLQSESSIYLDTNDGTWKCHHCTWIYPTATSGNGDPIQHPKAHCSHGVVNVSIPFVQNGTCFSLDTKGTESINGTTGMIDSVVAEKKLENGDSNPTTNGLDTAKSIATESINGVSGMKDRVIAHSVAEDKLENGGPDLATNGIDTVKNLTTKSANGVGGVKGSDVTTNGVEILKALAIESINGTGEVNSVVKQFSDEQKLGRGDTDVATKKSVASKTDDLTHNNLEEEQSGVHLLHSIGSPTNEITSLNPSDNPNPKLGEDSKQEVAEWDVERVIDEQETHDLYCPNCHSCITKRVILRKRKRRIQNLQPDTKREKLEEGQSSSRVTNEQAHDIAPSGVDANLSAADTSTQDRVEEPDVFRCLSCFSFFIPSVSIFKSFRIFGDRGAREAQNVPQTPVRTDADDKTSTFSSVTTTPQSQVSTTSSSVHHVETRFNNSEDKDTSKQLEGGYSPFQDQHTGPQFTGIFSANPQVPQLEHLKDGKNMSEYEASLSPDNHIGIGKDVEDLPMSTGAGKDVIVVIETDHTSTETSHTVGVPTPEISTAYGAGRQVDRATVSDRWDILKSIVYGGLVESITSLSIVSSAAGGGAGTLNIIALGLANLFGGLFIIAHGLVDLKREQYDGDHTEARHMDRYHELLGNKRRFTLHATVAILSYIIFGLVSPLTYGFSFRVTDNKEYKLIAVAVAALVCITLLAIAKALFYYICIGVMSSGVSYVIGVFVKKLLERLGLFEASAVDPVQPSGYGLIESVAGKSSWAPY